MEPRGPRRARPGPHTVTNVAFRMHDREEEREREENRKNSHLMEGLMEWLNERLVRLVREKPPIRADWVPRAVYLFVI